MKRKDIIIFLILFINSYQKDWTPLNLWDVTYQDMINSNNSLNYYFIDPDNLLSKEEINSTKREILSFGKKNDLIPYVFLIKNINFQNDITKEKYIDIFSEQLSQNAIRIFLENYISNDKLVLILISVDDKMISIKLGLESKSRISNEKINKIKKNSKSYFEKKDLKKTILSIISDFGVISDDNYDYYDKQNDTDYVNPFDFDDDDDDDELIDPYDEKIVGPHTPYKPKDDKKNEKKDDKKDDKKENNENKENDNVIRREKQDNSNFYYNLAIILIIIIICFGIIFYFLRKKIKILKLKNISYQKLIGTELESSLK